MDSLRVRSDIIVSERMHTVFSTALSIVNTEAKNLLNRSAIPAGVSALTLEGFCDWSAEEPRTVAMEAWPGIGQELELSFKTDHKRLGLNLKPVSMES